MALSALLALKDMLAIPEIALLFVRLHVNMVDIAPSQTFVTATKLATQGLLATLPFAHLSA